MFEYIQVAEVNEAGSGIPTLNDYGADGWELVSVHKGQYKGGEFTANGKSITIASIRDASAIYTFKRMVIVGGHRQ